MSISIDMVYHMPPSILINDSYQQFRQYYSQLLSMEIEKLKLTMYLSIVGLGI